jgi:hypothetical protein
MSKCGADVGATLPIQIFHLTWHTHVYAQERDILWRKFEVLNKILFFSKRNDVDVFVKRDEKRMRDCILNYKLDP